MTDASSVASAYGFGFVALSPTVFHRAPPEGIKPSQTSIRREPSLIILAAWMNASPRHVAKYTSGYQRLFPTARFLVLATSSLHFLFPRPSRRVQELEPVFSILDGLQPDETVLLHAISTGGGTTSWVLANEYKTRTGKPLLVSKTIFDCSPGAPGYAPSLAGLSVGLPKNPIIGGIVSGILRLFLFIWLLFEYATFRENLVAVMRRGLIDTNVIPVEAARLYIYSAKDKLVPPEDVESHAEEAQRKGYAVWKVKFLESGHAALVLHDEKRYWTAIGGLWNSEYLSSPGLIKTAF